ncbi:MAG: ferrochelatase [Sphingobacteriales bacterium]|nr:MAG: ferrochelatase [Sphingobacteriales bacterium]
MKEIIGVLLVNLGTPNSYKTADVRKYLNEFLTDGRVIDIPWLPRQLLVKGIITPFRSGNSAKSYKEIWTERGSPLKYISEDLAEILQKELQNNEFDALQFEVVLTMRYQLPDIASSLEKLRKKGVSHFIILPLFPQYASATTGSVHQKVMEIVSGWQTIPSISFVQSFFDHSLFIEAFAARGQEYDLNQFDHVLFSFHGLPIRQLQKADINHFCTSKTDCCESFHLNNRFCYSAQCWETARLIAAKLQIPRYKYTVCFQSRLGNDPWIQPYTIQTLENLAKEGKKKILVFCPAFVADCLETIFEIGVEYQKEFKKWGGEKVQLVESLNIHPVWVNALQSIILEYVPYRSGL